MPFPSLPSLCSSLLFAASCDEKNPYLFYYDPEPPVGAGALGIDVHAAWTWGGRIAATGNSFAHRV